MVQLMYYCYLQLCTRIHQIAHLSLINWGLDIVLGRRAKVSTKFFISDLTGVDFLIVFFIHFFLDSCPSCPSDYWVTEWWNRSSRVEAIRCLRISLLTFLSLYDPFLSLYFSFSAGQSRLNNVISVFPASFEDIFCSIDLSVSTVVDLAVVYIT